MTRTLTDDLRTLAHSGPTDPGAVIADRAGHMVRAIRRRRVARQTGMGAVGVGTAAAVMIGVSQPPGWLAGIGDHVGPADGLAAGPTGEATASPTGAPTPTASPVDAPTADPTLEPTPPTVDGADLALPAGLTLVADRYSIDLSCGAEFTFATQTAAGTMPSDHLSPRFEPTPGSATEPVHIVNEYGRDTPGVIGGGWARMTQAVVVTSDGVVVGFGGGTVGDGSMAEVHQEFDITLPALQMCPTTEPAGLVYTVYGISSEAGFDGVQHTGTPTADDEHLATSWGLSIDLATGEQWFGEPADRKTSVRDGLTPMAS